MNMIALYAALAAAFCWALSPFFSHHVSIIYGAISVVRWRMIIILCGLMIASLFLGSWSLVTWQHIIILGLSGIIGIFIGDSFLFAALRRLGPRRNAALYATNAPMAVFLGMFIGEHIGLWAMIGCLIVFLGVVLACFFGKKPTGKTHPFEKDIGTATIAISLGLGAALCQALGLLIARPVLDIIQGNDLHIVNATAIRIGASVLCFILWRLCHPQSARPLEKITYKGFAIIGISGLIGMGIAMPLFLMALRYGDAGIVASLASTSPVLVLPILWIITKEMPRLLAWVGAFLTIIGTAIIFTV